MHARFVVTGYTREQTAGMSIGVRINAIPVEVPTTSFFLQISTAKLTDHLISFQLHNHLYFMDKD